MQQDNFIPRRKEAEKIADLLSPDPLFGEIAGLFLAAPRRTGKSTFVRRDLMPLLEERGFLTLYVDLWSDKDTDPAELIKNRIRRSLEENDGVIARFRKHIPFKGVGALGFRVDLKETGQWEGAISDALALLCQATEKNIALIVDEAQHSLVSQDGMNAMFALKAARDEINQSDHTGKLYLVMTGSHRDKLASLVHDHKAPFFGASVKDFPPLGPEYTEMLAKRLQERMSSEAAISAQDLEKAFDRLARRPEELQKCLKELFLSSEFSAEALMQTAEKRIDLARQQLLSRIEALPDMQRKLLHLMVQDGVDFAPFTKVSREILGKDGEQAGTSSIQRGLDGLRTKEFIWRPGPGVYVLNDSEITQVLNKKPGL